MSLERLKVSENGRHLETVSGQPFFWLADTAWTLVNNLKLEDVKLYFENRKLKGFNIIQIVALDPETDEEMKTPYGEPALFCEDPLQPNEEYFKYLDTVIDLAESMGLYVGLVPAWGQLITGDNWMGQKFDILIHEKNAFPFGKWVGERYGKRSNIVWILGGDRHPVHLGTDYRMVWRRMAEGIGTGVTGKNLRWNEPDEGWKELLMTYHPTYSDDPPLCTSSYWLHDDAWLSFNMIQSAHRNHVRSYDWIYHDYNLYPIKPVLDGEPNYEDWAYITTTGRERHLEWNVRKRAYWSLFAGSFGHTYGHACMWCMIDEKRKNDMLPYTWKEALDRPGAQQMLHVRKLVESRPFFESIPDQSMTCITDNFLDIRVQARRAVDGQFAFFYFTCGGEMELCLEKMTGTRLNAWWYNPRDGKVYDDQGMESVKPFCQVSGGVNHVFAAPTRGDEQDWVLVLDNADCGYSVPGITYTKA